MKRQELKDKDDCSYWSSAKLCKGFSKINDSVKSSLQKWIISHPPVIQFTIENYYIKVKVDGENGGAKIELCQKALLQVSVHGPHMDILKKYATGFSMSCDGKGLVRVSGFPL